MLAVANDPAHEALDVVAQRVEVGPGREGRRQPVDEVADRDRDAAGAPPGGGAPCPGRGARCSPSRRTGRRGPPSRQRGRRMRRAGQPAWRPRPGATVRRRCTGMRSPLRARRARPAARVAGGPPPQAPGSPAAPVSSRSLRVAGCLPPWYAGSRLPARSDADRPDDLAPRACEGAELVGGDPVHRHDGSGGLGGALGRRAPDLRIRQRSERDERRILAPVAAARATTSRSLANARSRARRAAAGARRPRGS